MIARRCAAASIITRLSSDYFRATMPGTILGKKWVELVWDISYYDIDGVLLKFCKILYVTRHNYFISAFISTPPDDYFISKLLLYFGIINIYCFI